MTRPETCGAAGGAISTWVNVITCGNVDGGIVSSSRLSTAAAIFCYAGTIRYVRVISASDSQAGGLWFKSLHPTSAETHMWLWQLVAMLASYTGKGVTPDVDLSEHFSHMPLEKFE